MNDTPTPRTDERKASFALDTIRQLETELAAVTEQRDKAWQKIENQAERITYLEGAMLCRATGTPLSKAIEQRDRLAEALKELLTTGDNGYGTPTDKAWEMAEQAIAAVKGGSDELQG